MGNRQFISRAECSNIHASPIDTNAVGAAQIPYLKAASPVHHTTVVPRHPERFQTRIARGMSTDHDQVAIYRDVRALIKGNKA